MAQVTNRRLAMTLYSSDTCPRSHMVRTVLAEKGINYEVQQVDPENKSEDFIDLNPYGEVPTIVDRDLVLYNHQVIVEYLDERFPHPPLMPVDPVSRGRNRLMLHRVERDWYSLVDKIIAAGDGETTARKDLLDSLLSAMPIFDSKPYFLSDEITLIDCAIVPILWRLPVYGIELPNAAKPLLKYADKLFERDSFQESLTEGEREMRETF